MIWQVTHPLMQVTHRQVSHLASCTYTVPYGSPATPIHCKQITYGACGYHTLHMVPVLPHPPLMWCTHLVSNGHTWFQYSQSHGSRMSPIKCMQLPCSAFSSCRAPSGSNWVHMAPIPGTIQHSMAPRWHVVLPYGTCGSHMVSSNPLWHHLAPR
jgi:hypothetical protein